MNPIASQLNNYLSTNQNNSEGEFKLATVASISLIALGVIWCLGRTCSHLEKQQYQRALLSVQADGFNLARLNSKLRTDPRIVLAAVQQDGAALQFANQELRNNRTIVLAAIRQNDREQNSREEGTNVQNLFANFFHEEFCALQFASETLRADPEIVLAAVRLDGRALRFASDELRDDRRIFAAAYLSHAGALRFAGPNILALIDAHPDYLNSLREPKKL